MADRSEKPRAHLIEAAKSDRSTCQTCGKPIAVGELRLSEAFVTDEGRWAKSHQYARSRPRASEYAEDDRGHQDRTNPDVWARYHHLPCAAEHQPYKLKSALGAATIDIPERAALEEAIERALSAVDASEEDPATHAEYQQFIARLREAPDDDLLLVFADWLQSKNDPRGELIVVQRALEGAVHEERLRLSDNEKRILAVHRNRLVPERLDGTPTWHRGFVHRLALTAFDPTSLARAFAHPSLRLLRELVVEVDAWSSLVVAAGLPTPLPATLRVLELDERARCTSSSTPGLGNVAPVIAEGVPQLERLRLTGFAEVHDLKHKTLAELELGTIDAARPGPRDDTRSFADRIAGLERKRLPGLVRLILRAERGLDLAVAALTQSSVLKHLHTLALHGDLSPAGVDQLAEIKRLKLEVIDIRGTQLGAAELARLGKLAHTVQRDEAPAPAAARAKKVGEWLVRHTRKPEWGIGRVVEELDEGLQIDFEHAGAKQVRNVELLEEIEGPE